MSNEGDRAAVFRTTKVRNKLKGDGSWLQREDEPQDKTQGEKPWLAEVRASRMNGAPNDQSPVSSPTKSTPPPAKSDTESKAATPGYMIRGIFTKLDKPASSTTSNGINTTTQFTKKPSESYKKIAPHTVKPTSENQEGQLSPEEQEKRKEAASNVLKRSSVKKRSYVLSAAKKYEAKETSPDTSLANSSPSFVARRVEISDDESAETPAPANTVSPSPVVSATSAVTAPQPKPRNIGSTSVKTSVDLVVDVPEEPKEEEGTPEPVEGDLLQQPVTEKDPLEDAKPGCDKVDVNECVSSASTEPQPEDSGISGPADTPLVKLLPLSKATTPTPESPAPTSAVPDSTDPASPAPASTFLESDDPVSPIPSSSVLESLDPVPRSSLTPASPAPVSPAPISPVPESAVTDLTERTEPEPEPESEPEPEPESKQSPEPSSGVDTLTALSDTLISFDTSSSSFKGDEPALAEEEGGSAESHNTEDSVEQGPDPTLSNDEPLTDDLLGLSDGPEESAVPVPPSPGRWSQDLLSGLDSESNPVKTSGTLDLLANDVIVINTEARSLNMEREEEKQTDETAKETQSSSDLLQPLSDISINSSSPSSKENKSLSPEINMSTNALESLADDIIPINTDSTSPSSQQSWTRTWEASSPQQTDTEESQKAEPKAEEGQAEDQQTLIMFERKSNENDSPWDRWTSPTVYTITTATGEEEEEEEEEEDEDEDEEEVEESPEDTQETTTITTIREIQRETEPVMDRTVEEEEQHVQTPETKKGFVYVKEYVDTTEFSLHNLTDTTDSGSDNLASSSASYSYSSPSSFSRVSLSSTCTYCGEQVGNDAKITIDHLNINCHPACFKCDVCSKPMGDLIYSMFLHGGKVHCESCYATVI